MDSGRHKQPKGPRDPKDPKDPKDSKHSKHSKEQDPTAPGKVAVDSRGRNVWQFHGEAIDSTSMMLQRLENPALALEPTRKTKRLDAAADAAAGKAPGKSPGGKPAVKPAAGGAPGLRSSGRQSEPADTSQSFEQRFQVKPGKNSGGGFDPYNRS